MKKKLIQILQSKSKRQADLLALECLLNETNDFTAREESGKIIVTSDNFSFEAILSGATKQNSEPTNQNQNQKQQQNQSQKEDNKADNKSNNKAENKKEEKQKPQNNTPSDKPKQKELKTVTPTNSLASRMGQTIQTESSKPKNNNEHSDKKDTVDNSNPASDNKNNSPKDLSEKLIEIPDDFFELDACGKSPEELEKDKSHILYETTWLRFYRNKISVTDNDEEYDPQTFVIYAFPRNNIKKLSEPIVDCDFVYCVLKGNKYISLGQATGEQQIDIDGYKGILSLRYQSIDGQPYALSGSFRGIEEFSSRERFDRKDSPVVYKGTEAYGHPITDNYEFFPVDTKGAFLLLNDNKIKATGNGLIELNGKLAGIKMTSNTQLMCRLK